MNRKNRGISLIVLIITIIVIIILAGAVILNLTNNNPMDSAKKATFLNDLDTFKSELSLYQGKRYSDSVGEFEPKLLQADETSITYGSAVDATKTIKNIITSLGNTEKYSGQFIVIDGKLVYQGEDTKKQDWARDNGTEILIVGEPEVTILPPIDSVFKQGEDIVYIVKFNSNAALTTVNLDGKVEVLDDKELALTTQPNITIGTVSGTSLDSIRQVDVTIETDTLENGSYKLKIKEGAVTNANNMSNSFDKISLLAFDIDNTAPENPTILATPTTPTNGSVSVTITYSEDTQVKEYSFDTTLWQTYTSPIVVSNNDIIVYARGKDLAGNETGVATITVSNIDKISPTVVYGTNGETNVQTASTTVTVSDIGSGLNTSTLQYVWDTQNVSTPSSGWAIFVNGETQTKAVEGTYYLWVKATDNAGNILITKSNAFVIEKVVSGLTYSGETTGFSYNNPIIPTGFIALNTTDASWDNLSTDWDKGLVIQDVNGNQFVWVPIDGTNVTYAKWCITGTSYTLTTNDTLPTGVTNEQYQITTYGGFYIARYEAGKQSTDTLVSKKGATVWISINYTNSRAKSVAMYDTTQLKSGLVTGTQWDTVMKWTLNSGKSVTNSRTWGNYNNAIAPANVSGFGVKQVAGYSEQWKTKNIYDLAGNLLEWTNEINASYRMVRGGGYLVGGSDRPAAIRDKYNPASSDNYFSFRVVLYIL